MAEGNEDLLGDLMNIDYQANEFEEEWAKAQQETQQESQQKTQQETQQDIQQMNQQENQQENLQVNQQVNLQVNQQVNQQALQQPSLKRDRSSASSTTSDSNKDSNKESSGQKSGKKNKGGHKPRDDQRMSSGHQSRADQRVMPGLHSQLGLQPFSDQQVIPLAQQRPDFVFQPPAPPRPNVRSSSLGSAAGLLPSQLSVAGASSQQQPFGTWAPLRPGGNQLDDGQRPSFSGAPPLVAASGRSLKLTNLKAITSYQKGHQISVVLWNNGRLLVDDQKCKEIFVKLRQSGVDKMASKLSGDYLQLKFLSLADRNKAIGVLESLQIREFNYEGKRNRAPISGNLLREGGDYGYRFAVRGVNRVALGYGHDEMARLKAWIVSAIASSANCDQDQVKCGRIQGMSALVHILDGEVADYLLDHPNVVADGYEFRILRYPLFDICRRCGGFHPELDCTAQEHCVKCGQSHHLFSCKYPGRWCFRCGGVPKLKRLASKHAADDRLCPVILDILETHPLTLFQGAQ